MRIAIRLRTAEAQSPSKATVAIDDCGSHREERRVALSDGY